ncbi:MAG: RNA polymerase sporulation sigma factor SigH [Christensenellaceae bacterium]|jgi:RNA polymerase sporulation-specific sigma factor|nr:RNA polymerase sporulation sigma factor SigH [Christensenellaceae bacterium]
MAHVGALPTDEQLVAALRAGDAQAEELLYERYKNTVRAKARPYFLIGADRDDLIQEGMIGLYKAIRDYDPTRNAAFHSFAELCVTRQLISAIKTATRRKHMPLNSYVSFYSAASGQGDLTEVLELTAENPEDMLIHKESEGDMLRRIDTLLSPREKRVVECFLSGMSYQQIAEHLHCGKKSVDNALQRVKKKLEKSLEEG